MISCDDCQNKLVAFFDNEGSQIDEEFVWGHLRDCPECRVFHKDMVGLRKQFISDGVPRLSAEVGRELMQTVQEDCMRGKNLRGDKGVKNQTLLLRFPRLTWACSLAGLFLIVVSLFACFVLARGSKSLRKELLDARQEIAVAQVEKQLKEAQENQQKAISELHVRVKELEGHVQRGISPRTAWQSESPYYTPEHPGKL
jgi:hypothetical protein